MLHERNIVNGAVSVFLADMVFLLNPLKWFGVLAIILILADLRFGVEASKKRGEVVRFSRAIRRTINKMVDYTCWLFLAGSFGVAFGGVFGEYLPAGLLVIIFGVEINSCFSNYFEARGIKMKFDIFKFLKK